MSAEPEDLASDPTLEDLLRAVDEARDRVRHADTEAAALAEQLQAASDAFTKQALTSLVRSLRSDDRGTQLLVEAAKLPDVAALLTLHGIIRGGREREVLAVLEAMRPHLSKSGAGATLDRLEGQVVVLRFSGKAAGQTGAELQAAIERTITEHVPWAVGIRAAAEPTLIGGATLSMPSPWVDGPRLADVQSGRANHIKTDDVGVVLFKIGDQLRAYRNQCAHQGLPLDHAMVDGDEVQCIWHGYRYDALTGSGLTDADCNLSAVEVRVVDDVVQVRL